MWQKIGQNNRYRSHDSRTTRIHGRETRKPREKCVGLVYFYDYSITKQTFNLLFSAFERPII